MVLFRNATAALCTGDDEEAISAIEQALNDSEPLVREQATWSLETIRERRDVFHRAEVLRDAKEVQE